MKPMFMLLFAGKKVKKYCSMEHVKFDVLQIVIISAVYKYWNSMQRGYVLQILAAGTYSPRNSV
jgi:hypothetical protein